MHFTVNQALMISPAVWVEILTVMNDTLILLNDVPWHRSCVNTRVSCSMYMMSYCCWHNLDHGHPIKCLFTDPPHVNCISGKIYDDVEISVRDFPFTSDRSTARRFYFGLDNNCWYINNEWICQSCVCVCVCPKMSKILLNIFPLGLLNVCPPCSLLLKLVCLCWLSKFVS